MEAWSIKLATVPARLGALLNAAGFMPRLRRPFFEVKALAARAR
jgi:hypothetical protein